MYKVNWKAALGQAVIVLPNFSVSYVAELKFKTPLEGQPGFALIHRDTGVRMFEGVDIAYIVRKAIAEQLLLDTIVQDPEMGVQHPKAGDLLESFAIGGPAN